MLVSDRYGSRLPARGGRLGSERAKHRRGGFVLGYSAEIAVSDDRFVVAQRVTQNVTDNASLGPRVEEVEQNCGHAPEQVLADRGFFSIDNLQQIEQRNIDAYFPDSNVAQSLNLGSRWRTRAKAPAHRRMRRDSDEGIHSLGAQRFIRIHRRSANCRDHCCHSRNQRQNCDRKAYRKRNRQISGVRV